MGKEQPRGESMPRKGQRVDAPPPVAKVNVRDKLRQFSEHWTPKVVADVNDHQVKVVKFKGEFVWHKHENEDEMFMVVRGGFTMQFRDHDVRLREGEIIVVPRGVEHNPIADEEAEVLLFEPGTTLNTGNVRNERTIPRPERL